MVTNVNQTCLMCQIWAPLYSALRYFLANYFWTSSQDQLIRNSWSSDKSSLERGKMAIFPLEYSMPVLWLWPEQVWCDIPYREKRKESRHRIHCSCSVHLYCSSSSPCWNIQQLSYSLGKVSIKKTFFLWNFPKRGGWVYPFSITFFLKKTFFQE
jgi:hypothetical protein